MFRINPQVEWRGGGLASTSEDLARWAKLLYAAIAGCKWVYGFNQ
jgi:hypothetical protein